MQRRKRTGITIDGLTSRDLDDGFWLDEYQDHYQLAVSIADVASMVNLEMNQKFYDKALEQVETIYRANWNDPMLPRYLSEDRLSLLPGSPRPTITFTMKIDKRTLEVSDLTIDYSSFKSLKKFTYEQVDEILEQGASTKVTERMLIAADRLGQILLAKRRDNGALAIYDVNHGWCVNEEGQIVKMNKDQAHRSNIIIQEFMILTNVAVTEFLMSNNVLIILRNHRQRSSAIPREELLEEFTKVLVNPNDKTLNILRKRLNLTMERAEYGTKLSGHYGLNLGAYAHWTSPIRRVADLLNHIILHSWLDNKKNPFSESKLAKLCLHINEVKNKRRDEKSEYFKLAAKKLPANSGEPQSLKKLSDTKLEVSLKQVMKTSAPISSDDIIEEIRRKADRGALEPKEFFLVLFNAKFAIEMLRKEVFDSLCKSVNVASSVFIMAEQNKDITNAVFTMTPYGDKFICAGTATCNGKTYWTTTTTPAKGKTAKQMACLGLLQQIVQAPIESLATSRVVALPPVPGGEDYISALYMYGSQISASLSFDYNQKGPDNNRLFKATAQVTVEGITTKGISAWKLTKQAAKNAASRDLYEKLQKE